MSSRERGRTFYAGEINYQDLVKRNRKKRDERVIERIRDTGKIVDQLNRELTNVGSVVSTTDNIDSSNVLQGLRKLFSETSNGLMNISGYTLSDYTSGSNQDEMLYKRSATNFYIGPQNDRISITMFPQEDNIYTNTGSACPGSCDSNNGEDNFYVGINDFDNCYQSPDGAKDNPDIPYTQYKVTNTRCTEEGGFGFDVLYGESCETDTIIFSTEMMPNECLTFDERNCVMIEDYDSCYGNSIASCDSDNVYILDPQNDSTVTNGNIEPISMLYKCNSYECRDSNIDYSDDTSVLDNNNCYLYNEPAQTSEKDAEIFDLLNTINSNSSTTVAFYVGIAYLAGLLTVVTFNAVYNFYRAIRDYFGTEEAIITRELGDISSVTDYVGDKYGVEQQFENAYDDIKTTNYSKEKQRLKIRNMALQRINNNLKSSPGLVDSNSKELEYEINEEVERILVDMSKKNGTVHSIASESKDDIKNINEELTVDIEEDRFDSVISRFVKRLEEGKGNSRKKVKALNNYLELLD